MELISVVVVTYNSGKTVIETLDSIKNQTYPNLELIITDDQSKDNTVELVRKWLWEHKRRFVKARLLIAKKNHGVTKNCNIGISQVHGKYVQIVAGDDILLKSAIEEKYRFAKRKSLNLVCCRVEPFGKDSYSVSKMEQLCEKCFDIMRGKWEKQYENIFKFNFVIGPMCGFYLTEFLRKTGGFDTRFPMLEDWPFIFRYIVSGNEIELLDEVLTRYRISNTSISMKKDSPFNKSIGKFICTEIVKELVKSRRFRDAAVRMEEGLLMLWGEK